MGKKEMEKPKTVDVVALGESYGGKSPGNAEFCQLRGLPRHHQKGSFAGHARGGGDPKRLKQILII